MSAERDRAARRRRVARLVPSRPDDLFALRDAIVLDPAASVRAEALDQLDGEGARRLLVYVRDAALDPAAVVREAAFVALGRARDGGALPLAAAACALDRSFQVRRAAVLFAASTSESGARSVIAVASRDPFWRVRAAARRAGGAVDAPVELSPIADPPAEPDIVGITDADPAVTTDRLLAARATVDPAALVALLAHPHAPLRRIAVSEIGARGDGAALLATARSLRDERVPYAAAAAESALRRARRRARPIAEAIVLRAESEDAGPLAWAVRAASSPDPHAIEALAQHPDARVRRAVLARLPEIAPTRDALFEAMRAALDDPDLHTSCGAAAWLARTGSAAALRILRDAAATEARPTFVRRSIVECAAHAGDGPLLRRFLDDPHGSVRAAAAHALVDFLDPRERGSLSRDADPWVRRAVLKRDMARSAVADVCPSIREAAARLLSAPDCLPWALCAVDDPAAGVRALAASTLASDPADAATAALLRLARDPDSGVRSVAVEALELRTDLVVALLSSAQPTSEERTAAHTLLTSVGVSAPDAEAHPDLPRAHVALLDAVKEGRSPIVGEAPRESPRPLSPEARSLGRTGIRVHPLGLSGVHALDASDFAEAHARGVDLFFWEPSHRELARFLRHAPAPVVVAGTYHADAASIEADAVRALRVLRRGAIDVFLAFWTRSTARLDAILEPLGQLKRRGLVRAIGVSTHDRALAHAAAERGLDVVMVRHSAAHRGAEDAVFPVCDAHGTGVITFSNLCYGRMLHRTGVHLTTPISAPDCYRYSLSQRGVHACIAAPRRRRELDENLGVLGSTTLTSDRIAELRRHGDEVYARAKATAREGWVVALEPERRGLVRAHPAPEIEREP